MLTQEMHFSSKMHAGMVNKKYQSSSKAGLFSRFNKSVNICGSQKFCISFYVTKQHCTQPSFACELFEMSKVNKIYCTCILNILTAYYEVVEHYLVS